MKTKLGVKELRVIVAKHRGYCNPRMTKKNLMEFIIEASKGNNKEWLPVYEEVKRVDMVNMRNEKLMSLGI